MNALVKFITDEDGGVCPPGEKWHWIQNLDACRALCNGQVFGYGESAVKYKTKKCEKGGINCPDCLEIIREIKNIKL